MGVLFLPELEDLEGVEFLELDLDSGVMVRWPGDLDLDLELEVSEFFLEPFNEFVCHLGERVGEMEGVLFPDDEAREDEDWAFGGTARDTTSLMMSFISCEELEVEAWDRGRSREEDFLADLGVSVAERLLLKMSLIFCWLLSTGSSFFLPRLFPETIKCAKLT